MHPCGIVLLHYVRYGTRTHLGLGQVKVQIPILVYMNETPLDWTLASWSMSLQLTRQLGSEATSPTQGHSRGPQTVALYKISKISKME